MDFLESETIDADMRPSATAVLPTCSVGDTLSGRYRLDEELGRGGMGIVYRAWDVELERPVAVKVMATHLEADDARERLLREARAAAALSHPHVVAVHDVGVHEGMPYFVMELVEGPSLKQCKPESLEEIVALALQICDALVHAHQHGLVHRDLKPANILLSGAPRKPAVKIVDLGLAVRERGVRITRAGGITGTVAYMAPEQALGREVDARTDLYALGVMLYELTTGRLPFDGDNALAVLSQHLHAPVVPPRTYRADLPEHLEAAILRLLAKNPDDRFASAAEVAEVLASDPGAASAPAAVSGALGGLVRGRLVGRDVELAVLRRAWSAAAAGRGGLVLVSGEPGSGKSRLARELVDYARITGGSVLRGGCYELEAATPYLPFIEALRTWVHESSDDELRAAAGSAGAELARLAPELESRIGPFPEGPELSAAEQRLRLFDGVARCLINLARPKGMLLFVDDLQWADQASLSLLHYLVRVVDRERVLVLGCYRETDLDRSHPLAEALDSWNRERAATRVHLRRLDAAATAAMLKVLLGQSEVSDDLAASIHRETEGNPFFIEEIVKTLVDEGQIVCEIGGWCRRDSSELVLPQGVKAAIGRRLDHLSERTTEVLRTAAILGKSFEFSELAAVSDRSEDELLDAVDEAVAAQLLEAAAGETVAFTHDKIREVLYHELNPIRRRRLHYRVANALEALREQGGRVAVEDLAHHAMEGGCLERGFEYAMQAAADAASLYAYGDSLRLYERARECAEASDRADQLPRIDAAMGEVYALKGEPLAAAEYYERALAATTDPTESVRLKCLVGECYVVVGDRRALAYVAEARAALDPETQPAEVARATMIEARFHHYHGQSAKAAELLHQAVEPAERVGDAMLLGWIYGYLAGAYQHLVEFEESNGWAQRCIDLGAENDNPNVESIGVEFHMENAFMRGRWSEAIEHSVRHLELGRKACSSDRLAWNHLGATYARIGLGELAAAEACADEGIELADRLGDERLAVFLGSWKALIAADAGRIDEAVALAERWLERAAALGLKSGHAEALRVRAYVAQRAGDHRAAIEHALEDERVLEGTDERVNPVWLSAVICESLIAEQRLDEAEARNLRTLEMARKAGMSHFEALASRVSARLRAAGGDDGAARAELDAAVEIFDRLGSRIELGRTLELRGALTEGAAAGADRERARELFEACGAVADLQRLEP
ncbi:MAG TPA: AAA family ATPase [Chondromyces sp.]|nr:AAA family ATPase [Chondromyces sp.]